jgi:hypothetical protein
MQFTTPARRGKGMEYVGKLESVLVKRANLLPLDKYIIFQLANWCSIFLILPFQIDLEGETPHPIIPSNSSTLATSPTGTNFELALKTFKPETA